MVYFYSSTGWIGQILDGLTTNVTGSVFLTLLLVFVLFLVAGLALRIPPIALAIMYLPLLFVMASMTSDFTAIIGAVLIYLGYVLAVLLYPQ